MISAVKHAASMRNPEFDARQRARRSTWDTPRFLYSYDETLNGDLVLPRGLHPLLTELVESADSTLHLDDKRILGQPHTFTCSTPLRTVQTTALHQLLEQDTGVLIAPPGTGKTVISCAAIQSRSTSTLILVDRKALADQWRDRISSHLGFAMWSDRWRTFRTTVSSTSRSCRRLPAATTSKTSPPTTDSSLWTMPPRRHQRILRRPRPHSCPLWCPWRRSLFVDHADPGQYRDDRRHRTCEGLQERRARRRGAGGRRRDRQAETACGGSPFDGRHRVGSTFRPAARIRGGRALLGYRACIHWRCRRRQTHVRRPPDEDVLNCQLCCTDLQSSVRSGFRTGRNG